jgi:hypothetical protein
MDEYQHLAALGNRWIDIAKRDASPATGLDEHWDKIRADAFREVQKPWGGATIDAHTGVPVKHNADVYARASVTTCTPSRCPRRPAMSSARDGSGPRAVPPGAEPQPHLGVFHDDENTGSTWTWRSAARAG